MLFSHRAKEAGVMSKILVRKPTPRFQGLFTFISFSGLSGWVNFSHRSWLPRDAFYTSCSGSNQVTTFFLLFWIFLNKKKSLSSRSGSREIAQRDVGHFLFHPFNLPYAHQSFLNLPFLLNIKSSRGIHCDSLNSQVVSEHHEKNHSFFCLGLGFSLYNPVQYISNFFFSDLKSKELQNCL